MWDTRTKPAELVAPRTHRLAKTNKYDFLNIRFEEHCFTQRHANIFCTIINYHRIPRPAPVPPRLGKGAFTPAFTPNITQYTVHFPPKAVALDLGYANWSDAQLILESRVSGCASLPYNDLYGYDRICASSTTRTVPWKPAGCSPPPAYYGIHGCRPLPSQFSAYVQMYLGPHDGSEVYSDNYNLHFKASGPPAPPPPWYTWTCADPAHGSCSASASIGTFDSRASCEAYACCREPLPVNCTASIAKQALLHTMATGKGWPASWSHATEPCEIGWNDTHSGWQGLRCTARGGAVEYVNMSHTASKRPRGDVTGWAAMKQATTIDLNGTNVWGNITGWAAMEHITSIDLGNTQVVGGVGGWSAMTHATDIVLESTYVTGDVGGWSTMTRATTINLNSATNVIGNVSGWSAMTQATTIDLNNTRVTGLCQQGDQGAKEIGRSGDYVCAHGHH